MPISVRYLNNQEHECVIRPAPLVSITDQVLRNKEGVYGKNYTITLTGYLIVDQGFPLAKNYNGVLFPYWDGDQHSTNMKGPYGSFDPTWSHAYIPDGEHNRPKSQLVPYESALDAMMFKQKVIRELFARDGQRLEIIPIHTDEPTVICYPRVVSIDFAEGIYTDYTTYTVVLEADTLLDFRLDVDKDGIPKLFNEDGTPKYLTAENEPLSEEEILALRGYYIESYNDTWSLNTNEDSEGDVARTYSLTRNISAVGKDHYYSESIEDGQEQVEKRDAWENARDFVHNRLSNNPFSNASKYRNYPNKNPLISSGVLNLIESYGGYSHSRNEEINSSEGSYSISETWFLAKDKAYENFDSSVDVSVDNAFVKVNINGNIKGMLETPPSGSIFGGNLIVPASGKYANALSKYYEISDSGRFNIRSDIFKRANNLVAVELNAQPLSISVSFNEQKGDIGYTVSYDNRPTNIISGVLTEDISINDTHPGDVFASIPIIGRKNGPILQPIRTRTEYSRDVSINLLLDYTDVAYGSKKDSLIRQKPSLVCPIRGQIIDLLKELSPSGEAGVRKWFVNPIQENWSPKTGSYSIQVNWVYEKE
jgi:hypothetical protein